MKENYPTAVITGASKGIGKAIALSAAKKGYQIAFCYRSDEEGAKSLGLELDKLGVKYIAEKVDVSSEEQVLKFFKKIDETFGQIDLLVNNAGCTSDGLLVSMSIKQMHDVMNTNIIGSMMFAREALQLMIPKKKGSIVNISSISATKPNRGQSNYAASKGAIESFTKALSVEVASRGIRVNAVAPGVICTDMVRKFLDNEIYKSKITDRILTKKLGQPEDVAEAVMYLADPKNHYVTGQVLHVDGGLALS